MEGNGEKEEEKEEEEEEEEEEGKKVMCEGYFSVLPQEVGSCT